MSDVSEANGEAEAPVVIKKYANRRLYNTATSSYVTLDDLAVMVKQGDHFVVKDAKTGDDITRSVLTQIIFEEENKGQNLLPINFLRQLIRFYGDNMQAFVPSYLEFSLDTLFKEQEKLRAQMVDAMGANPINMVEEQAKRNMAMFQQAMAMFNPFAAMQEGQPPTPAPASKPEETRAADKDKGKDLDQLRQQMEMMQKQLEKLSGK